MKKLIIYSLFILGMVSLSSCKKDRYCVCDYPTGFSNTYTVTKSSKKEAQEVCDEKSVTQGYLGATCALQ